ncbi:MAG: ubiquinone/menaquinone biosynthesis methylase-like protein [Gallionellaceae bacterium]|nr:MAG: ubiquinone/menaquinone biosynthesis methylase-like protein [Gallionellaceae bacterium]
MVSKLHSEFPCEHLDIGAGHGELIELMRTKFELQSSACDYTDSLMKLSNVSVKIADLSNERLPFPDESFDLVTCTEVIEHLEHYRSTLRDIHRVLKPNGTLVLTTPNILNLKSRIRFLIFGFYNLFGPLHVSESELHTTGGHINPVSYFFLSHSLLDAGFKNIEVSIDKKQGSSLVWLLPLWIPIQLFSKLTLRKEKRKYKTVDEHNEGFVLQMNSLDILLGRTIVVGCKRA